MVSNSLQIKFLLVLPETPRGACTDLVTVELRLFPASAFLPKWSSYLEHLHLHHLEKSCTPLMSQLHGRFCQCLLFYSQADIICPLLCIPNGLNTFLFFETQFIMRFFSWTTKSSTSSAIPYSFFLHPVRHDISPKYLLVGYLQYSYVRIKDTNTTYTIL